MIHSHQRAHQQALETYASFVVCSIIGGRCYHSKSQQELGRKCSTRAYYSNNFNWCMKSAFMYHTRVVTRFVSLTSSSATLLQQIRLLSVHPPAHISYLSHFSSLYSSRCTLSMIHDYVVLLSKPVQRLFPTAPSTCFQVLGSGRKEAGRRSTLYRYNADATSTKQAACATRSAQASDSISPPAPLWVDMPRTCP